MTSSEPLVTVVIPVYNRSYCVVEAVQSVLDQTYARIECVVVDDGSSDDTVARLEASFSAASEVKILAQEHAGVSSARNRGVAAASGEYLTFLDSDDLMVANRIERQLGYLADGSADAVLGRQEHVLVDGASRPAWLQRRPEWWDGYYHMSILVETRRVRDIGGFDESLEIGEDVDVVARLAGSGVRIGRLDEVVVIRRYSGDNASYGIEGDEHQAIMDAVRRHRARRREMLDP